MANSYFQCKQFRIEQNLCAMKVSTDACILGAYISLKNIKNAKNIIDIGTGTGLLALMLAQKADSDAKITAIEIDESAAKQAFENIKNSKWATQIELVNKSIQEYSKANIDSNIGYDLAICNPPFFINSTLPTNKKQQMAHHTTELSFDDLWYSVEKILNKNGLFAVLLPIQETEIFTKIGKKYNFLPTQQLIIQDSPKHKPHRIITIYTKENNAHQNNDSYFTLMENLLIKDSNGIYSQSFIDLLQSYYLYL